MSLEYTEEQLTQAYKDMAASADGQMIIDDLTRSFYNVHSFTPNGGDPNTVVFMEGCRWVVGYIKDQINSEDPPKADNHSRGSYI